MRLEFGCLVNGAVSVDMFDASQRQTEKGLETSLYIASLDL